MLGKTSNDLTNTMPHWQTSKLLKRKPGHDDHIVHACPQPGGRVLRFAYVKRYRRDKTAAQADTLETVRRLFLARARGAQL